MTSAEIPDPGIDPGFESSGDDSGGDPALPISEVEVFWRPGCPFCSGLRRDLRRRGVPATWRNIWEDKQALEVVCAANRGNETVPTVRVRDRTLPNPSWRQLSAVLGDGPWQETPARGGSDGLVRVLSWVPVLLMVIVSLALTFSGHDGLAWGADALAVLAWLATRSLRR